MLLIRSTSTNITITPRIAAMIYDSADTVIEAAPQLLEHEDKRARLQAALAKGDEGDPIPYTPELLASIERSARRRFESGEVPSASDVFP